MLNSSTPRSQKRKLRPKNRGNKKRKVTIQEDDSTTDSAADADGSDSSGSDEIDWKKLEEELEENAAKANLTTINVKSILHHILADKRVIEYAKTVADSAGSYSEEVLQDTKLTRSKAKLLGQQPLPLEDNKEKKPKFLELNFNESSSDDEEYQPKEEEGDTSQASDEDFSTFSDAHSELQSPYITASHTEEDTVTESDTSTLVLTPTQNVEIAKEVPSSATKKELFKVPNVPTKMDQEQIDLISSRTRSRLPMPGVEVEELEALFQPPDSTALDFSVQNYDDPDEVLWKNWLCDFTKPMKALDDTGEDELNDEDFNYMEAAAENDTEVETEELRDDKATRVTQKELQELFNELLLGYEQNNMNTDVCYQYCDNWESDVNISQSEAIIPQLTEAAQNLTITYKQRQQISSQMQQHVQLLAQIYLLSCTNQTLRHECTQCKQYIDELAMFHDKALENSNKTNCSIAADHSTFCTPGISDAYRITSSLAGKKLATKHAKKLNGRNPVNDSIAELLSVEPYFATYIELIPEQGMIPEKTKGLSAGQRMKFLTSEDNLLAIGLEQWRKMKDKYDLIAQHLLPTKTPRQLEVRVKNLCSSRGCRNPVAVVKKEKYLPDFEVKTKIIVPRDISSVSLCDLPHNAWKRKLAPYWFLKIKRKLKCKYTEEKEKRIVSHHEARHDLFELAPKNTTPVSNANTPDDGKCNRIENTTSVTLPNLLGADVAHQPIVLCPHLISSTPLPVNACSTNVQMRQCYSDPLHMLKFKGNPQVDRTKTDISESNFHRKVNRSLRYTPDEMSVSFTDGMNTIRSNTDDHDTAVIPISSCGYNGIHYATSKKSSVAQQTGVPIIEVLNSSADHVPAIGSNSQSIVVSDTAISSTASFVSTDTIGLRTPTKTDSLDNFNTPVTQLFNDLPPSPKSFPLNLLSPSKPFQETSLKDVKQFLKTPLKSMIISSQESKVLVTQNTDVVKENPSSEALGGDNLQNRSMTLLLPLPPGTAIAKQNKLEVVSKPDTVSTDLENVKSVVDRESKEELESCNLPASHIDENNFHFTNEAKDEAKITICHPGNIGESPATNILTENTTVSPDRTSSLSCYSGPVGSDAETDLVEVNENKQVILVNIEQEVNAIPTTHKVNNNSTLQQKTITPKKVKTIKQKKPPSSKYVFDYNERLKKKAQIFVKIYFNRVKETLVNEPELLAAFFELLQNDSKNRLSKLESYYRVADLLVGYPELVDNFAGFLEQHEARHVGKFQHWLIYDSIVHFHLSCEQYFFNTPGWYAKINQKILEVLEKEKDPHKIVEAVSPLFRCNQDITNQFIRLFPDLPPPMCDGDEFEVIDFAAVSSGSKEIDDFEEIAYQPPDGEHSLQLHDEQRCRRKSESVSRGNTSSLKFPRIKSNTNIAASKLRQLATKRKKNRTKAQKSVFTASDIETGESLEADTSGNSSVTTVTSSEEHLTDGELQESLPMESKKKCLEAAHINKDEKMVSISTTAEAECLPTVEDEALTNTNTTNTGGKNLTTPTLESNQSHKEQLKDEDSEKRVAETHLTGNIEILTKSDSIVGGDSRETLHCDEFVSLSSSDVILFKGLSVEINNSKNVDRKHATVDLVSLNNEKCKEFDWKNGSSDEKLANEMNSNQTVNNGYQSKNSQSTVIKTEAVDFAVVSSTTKFTSDIVGCVTITDSKDQADDEVDRIMREKNMSAQLQKESEENFSCTPVVDDVGLLETENAQFNISSGSVPFKPGVLVETAEVFGQDLTFDSFSAVVCHSSSVEGLNNSGRTSRNVERRSVTPRRLPKSEIITLERRDAQTVIEFHAGTEDFPSSQLVSYDREGCVTSSDNSVDVTKENDVVKVKEDEEIGESIVEEIQQVNQSENFDSPNHLNSATNTDPWDKATDRLLLTIVMHAGEVNQVVMDEIFQKFDGKFTKAQIKERVDFLLESFDDCEDDGA